MPARAISCNDLAPLTSLLTGANPALRFPSASLRAGSSGEAGRRSVLGYPVAVPALQDSIAGTRHLIRGPAVASCGEEVNSPTTSVYMQSRFLSPHVPASVAVFWIVAVDLGPREPMQPGFCLSIQESMANPSQDSEHDLSELLVEEEKGVRPPASHGLEAGAGGARAASS